MAIHQVKVGKDLYVFTSRVADANANSWSARPNCIIDSHGFRPPTKPYFTAKADILFYVDRHAFLVVSERYQGETIVNSIAEIANRKVKWREKVARNAQCPDYQLSKQVKFSPDTVLKINPRYDDIGYDELRTYFERHQQVADQYDLISIRNRAFRIVYLSEALSELR